MELRRRLARAWRSEATVHLSTPPRSRGWPSSAERPRDCAPASPTAQPRLDHRIRDPRKPRLLSRTLTDLRHPHYEKFLDHPFLVLLHEPYIAPRGAQFSASLMDVNERLIASRIETSPGHPDDARRIGELVVEFGPPARGTLEYPPYLLPGSKRIFQLEVERI